MLIAGLVAVYYDNVGPAVGVLQTLLQSSDSVDKGQELRNLDLDGPTVTGNEMLRIIWLKPEGDYDEGYIFNTSLDVSVKSVICGIVLPAKKSRLELAPLFPSLQQAWADRKQREEQPPPPAVSSANAEIGSRRAQIRSSALPTKSSSNRRSSRRGTKTKDPNFVTDESGEDE